MRIRYDSVLTNLVIFHQFRKQLTDEEKMIRKGLLKYGCHVLLQIKFYHGCVKKNASNMAFRHAK